MQREYDPVLFHHLVDEKLWNHKELALLLEEGERHTGWTTQPAVALVKEKYGIETRATPVEIVLVCASAVVRVPRSKFSQQRGGETSQRSFCRLENLSADIEDQTMLVVGFHLVNDGLRYLGVHR